LTRVGSSVPTSSRAPRADQSRWLDRFSEGTRPTSTRTSPHRACRAGRATVRRPGPAPVRPVRAVRVPACPLCQCCPRQALRATRRCLAPRVESSPQSGEVEPPVRIEQATFSLRGGTTASHLLSTSGFSNTAAPSEREIPHAYPPFGATSDATRRTAFRCAALDVHD